MKTRSFNYDSSRSQFSIFSDLVELTQYRDLLLNLVQRDLTVRYKRSVLGFLWTMLNPLLIMLVMTIVFSSFFQFQIEHYPVYLLAGLVAWNFFSQSTTSASSSLVWAGGLINKIYIPKAIFVVTPILVNLINLLFALIPLCLIIALTGHAFTFALFFLPVSILLLVIFALGIALILATFAVFFTDVVDIYQIGLMVAMYLTPLFYPISIVPAQYLGFIKLNPVYYFVEIFRQPIFQGVIPSIDILAPAVLIALLALGIGWWLFTSKSNEFAYRV